MACVYCVDPEGELIQVAPGRWAHRTCFVAADMLDEAAMLGAWMPAPPWEHTRGSKTRPRHVSVVLQAALARIPRRPE